MFNYVFPIFCFGLVITGIVYLGILQAAGQLKADSAKKSEGQTLDHELENTSSRRSDQPRSAVRNSNE